MITPPIHELTDRARDVFRIVVESYLDTGAPVGSRTISRISALNLSPAAIALVHEKPGADFKTVTVRLTGAQGLDRAISSAGGIRFEALAPDFELKALPDVYAIGEMLDWEAPTGGYLLQACFSTAVAAAQSILEAKKPHLR